MHVVLAAGVCALGAACAAPAHDVTRWPSCATFGETLGPLVAELERPVMTLRHDDPGMHDALECRWPQPVPADVDGLDAVLRGGDIRLTIEAGPFARVPDRLRHADPRAAAIGGDVQSDDGVFDPDAVVDVFAPRVVAGDIRVAVDQMPFTSASQSGHRLTVDEAVAAAVDVHRALRAHTHE